MTANEVSHHAPHLIDSRGSLTPAALIPFCAYQTDMTLVGQTRKDLPFAVCSLFRPTVLGGQRCYTLNLSMITKDRTGAGLDNGLLVLLDSNTPEKEQNIGTEPIGDETIMSLKMEAFSSTESSSRIYLNTLSSFTDDRAGSYALTGLKKMTGTESFLKQPDKKRKCRIETIEECKAKSYIEKVQKICGCVPWALSINLTVQV